MRTIRLAIVAAAAALVAAGADAAYIEPPSLKDQVAQGKLPPVERRLPDRPLVDPMTGPERAVGTHGGDLRTLMAGGRDTRMMVVYGYARLVGYNRDFEIVPDILERFEVKDGRVFTFHLRKGHRWSDGHPFTSEDFRYYWEDVANNQRLSPTGVPASLLAGGEKPTIEFPDAYTVRYAWPKPHPTFLSNLAGAAPLFIFRPAHYLKQFHERYQDPEKLAALAKAAGQRNWAPLHNLRDNQYRNDNIELPTLDPWINTTPGPADRFVFVRNPYYHRVDRDGRQLPYIDRVVMNIADGKIIAAKVAAGEVDLQARYLRFDNYTLLRDAQKRQDFETRLWRTGVGSQIALYPNLNVRDPAWKEMNRDVRFRRALSLAIDRHEVNQVIYYGLAQEAQNTVLPESALYRKEYAQAWATFDPKAANALLDEIGLTQRDSRGFRKLLDGRTLEIIVETAGESTEQVDVLELVRDTWQQIGVKLFTKPSQREVFRNRVFAGETMMAAWWGVDNAVPTPDMAPDEMVPMHQDRLMWPKWGQFYETKGKAGEVPDMKWGKALMELYDAWRGSADQAGRVAAWHKILQINADEVTSIGIVQGVPQPVVIARRLRNLPQKGIFCWEPGAHFGIYRMDSLWYDTAGGRTAAASSAK